MSVSIVDVQKFMTHYVLSVVLAFGLAGNLLLLVVFSQNKQRLTLCAHYLLTGVVMSIIGSIWAVTPLIYSATHPDPLANSLALCRIRGYIIHSCAMSFRSLIVLAAADRYFSTSERVILRAFSTVKAAQRMSICVPVFWFSVSVHLLIFVSIENNRCFVYGLYGFIYSIYQLVCFGLLPSILMAIFGGLALRNIYAARHRVQPIQLNEVSTNQNVRRKREKNMAMLVFIEVIVSIICTLPYSINSIYVTLTSDIAKTVERQQIESFLVFITMWFLLYLKYSTTFYVYIITSASFRRLFKKIVLKYITKCKQILQRYWM